MGLQLYFSDTSYEFCGGDPYGYPICVSSGVSVSFHSDSGVGNQGFKLEFTMDYDGK